MKTQLLTITLLLISAGTFAQKVFTKATFDAMLAEYQANSKTFFTNRLSTDFRYTTANGLYQNRSDIVSGEAQKILSTELVEPVIFQSGDLAVVSGIHKTERPGADGNPVVGQVACTYTFQRRADKWLFVASQHTAILLATVAEDEAAIKKVIEGLTTASYTRDFNTYLNYWVDAPYVSRVSSDLGNVTKLTGDTYRKMVEGLATKPGEPTRDIVTRDNWLIRVNGNSAFVVFDQYNARPDGTTRHSLEERYLERVNSEWKLVNVTVVVAK